MKLPKGLTVVEAKILEELASRGKLPLSELEREYGEAAITALARLEEKGYVAVKERLAVLTKACLEVLSERKLGPRAMLIIGERGVTLARHSVKTRRIAEALGLTCLEGYVLAGAPAPPRSPPSVDDAWQALLDGKLRYAALKAYQLSVKLRDAKLISEARRNLEEPTYKRTSELLRKIEKRLYSRKG